MLKYLQPDFQNGRKTGSGSRTLKLASFRVWKVLLMSSTSKAMWSMCPSFLFWMTFSSGSGIWYISMITSPDCIMATKPFPLLWMKVDSMTFLNPRDW